MSDMSHEDLEARTRAYAQELRGMAAQLREGTERWRFDEETAGELAERLGAQWIDSAFSHNTAICTLFRLGMCR